MRQMIASLKCGSPPPPHLMLRACQLPNINDWCPSLKEKMHGGQLDSCIGHLTEGERAQNTPVSGDYLAHKYTDFLYNYNAFLHTIWQ